LIEYCDEVYAGAGPDYLKTKEKQTIIVLSNNPHKAHFVCYNTNSTTKGNQNGKNATHCGCGQSGQKGNGIDCYFYVQRQTQNL